MEDRNDAIAQKLKRYVDAFSKDVEQPKDEESTKSSTEQPITESNKEKSKKSKQYWSLIRKSIECEKEECVDCPNFKFL